MLRRRNGGAGARTLICASWMAAFAVLTVSAQEAFALQGGEDPASLPILIDKRFSRSGSHQLSLLFSTGVVTKFVESTGAVGAYEYSFSDVLGLELSGGYLFGRESDTMEKVRAQVASEPSFSDLYQLQWFASADLVVVPVYGKVSFASTFDPSFDVFVLAGGGVAGVRRQQGVGEDETFLSKVTPVFNLGLGLRFYLFRSGGSDLALRFEIRDYFFPEPDPNEGGVTFDLHFQGGLQFAFGGDR